MNGAESLVRTLLAGGVDVCFANPGTSEMHFVAALDQHPEMRCVLGLQENTVTGAADGYARMTGTPAATLLHLGSGLANGLANIHNARRANTPMVNVVGEHASYHIQYDAPLTSDIAGIARPVSDWVGTAEGPETVAGDAATAIRIARTYPGRIATLILPGDAAWDEGAAADAVIEEPPVPPVPADETIEAVAKALGDSPKAALLMTGRVLHEDGLELAGRIAAKTGATLLVPTANRRIARGAGRVPVVRVPYVVDQARAMLAGFTHVVLVGAKEPVGFFAYPGKPGLLLPDGCQVLTLARPEEDGLAALAGLVEALDAGAEAPHVSVPEEMRLSACPLDPETLGVVIAQNLPENAIVADESITSGRKLLDYTEGSSPHDWLQNTGGAIGSALPLATGAAVACPDRKVMALQADGGGMYTLQALWTQAREGLDVTTVIFANRRYQILLGEMTNVGVVDPGPSAMDMLTIDRPDLDWVKMAEGMGVAAERVDESDGFAAALARGLAEPGPYLVEAVMP